MRTRTDNLDDETRAGFYREPKAVQLEDRRDQAETESDSLRLPASVRTVEAADHDIALLFADARSRVADAHDAFAGPVQQRQLHLSALRREFHGVVDEVRDRFEKEIAIAVHRRRIADMDAERDLFSSAIGS